MSAADQPGTPVQYASRGLQNAHLCVKTREIPSRGGGPSHLLTWGGNESGHMHAETNNTKSDDLEIPFTSAQAKALSKYWGELARKANGIPSRNSFDPIAIPTLLPYIMLWEQIDTDHYQIKLQGTDFDNRGVTDMTGTILRPNDQASASNVLYEAVERVIKTPCGLHIIGIERNSQGRNALIEGLGLPLTDETGTVRFLVAIVVALETIDYSDQQSEKESLIEVRQATVLPVDQLLAP